MNTWTRDLILSIVIAAALGLSVVLAAGPSAFFFWMAGIAVGFGLRIAVVNVWPDIFRPRIAYEKKQRGSCTVL